MRKVWIIALREYRATVKTKTFIIALVVMPVLMGGGIFVQAVTEGRIDTAPKRIAVVDHSGRMFAALQEAVQQRNRKEIIDPETGAAQEPLYELQQVMPQEGRQQQLLALSEQVRGDALFAFIEIPADILDSAGRDEEPSISYYSNQPTYRAVRRWLSRSVSARVQSVRLAEAGIDQTVVERAMQPVGVENLNLLTTDASGAIKEAEKVNPAVAFGVPFGMVMLMFMALAITTQPLLNSVLEEKMQRIAEVLLGAVTPFQLMIGKLLGYVSVAITLVGVYLIGGYAAASYAGLTDLIPAHLLAWFVLFMVLSILMYGSLFLATGSCCNDYKEAQNLMLPIWLVVCLPLFALGTVISHPNSQFAMVLSLFPPATPMLMVLRLAMPSGVPLWQVSLGVVGTLLTTTLFVWAAGRVFRLGLLLQGKPPKLSQLLRWVVRS